MTTQEKLSALRHSMSKIGLDAYIVFGTDPHQSEYVPAHSLHRAWISGFTGSAGTVVVTMQDAGLWTDSRYYLEAENALGDGPIRLHRQDDPGVPPYPDYLRRTLPPGAVVGCDAACLPISHQRSLTDRLGELGIRIRPGADLVGPLWEDRPSLPSAPAYALDPAYTGSSRTEKLQTLRQAAPVAPDVEYFVTALDEIAWLLNIRGNDIPYNPLVVSYLMVHPHGATWFVDTQKVPDSLRKDLLADQVKIAPYEEAREVLSELADGSIVVVDPQNFSRMSADAVPDGVRIVEHPNGVASLKAIKTEHELNLLRDCMARDGAALLRFLSRLEAEVENLNELSAAEMLREIRAADPLFVEESFGTISGYGAHGAIVHYSVDADSAADLAARGIYLIDSGAHYKDGTTDITRTVALGPPDKQSRRDYTLVLKGHIALSRLQFPAGCTGTHIDAVARLALWADGKNYGHGTGHGLGFFLNVHEGPQRISPTFNSTPLEPGMLLSNEPGLYRSGHYGIRIENIVVVTEREHTEFGRFLGFDTLSLCPFDRRLIEPELLDSSEIAWINEYHQNVHRALSPHLDDDAMAYLDYHTEAL